MRLREASPERTAARTVLDGIGGAPLVRVDGVWAKCEFLNPSGSVKARIAKYMVERAEDEGLLHEGDTIVEASSGNTGNALAMVAAVKGYRMLVVMPTGMSSERLAISRAFGAEVLEVARATGCDSFVRALPQDYETVVGERGARLSGGQRQRLAIARALLRPAPVLLLDEATSALDAESEALVQAALARLTRGRTTLVIAHRLATVRAADRILVLDEGRLVAEGTHAALLARQGVYWRLSQLQSLTD